jgi:hypothetical protein
MATGVGLWGHSMLTWGAILVARQTAYLGHDFNQCLHVLQDGALQLPNRKDNDESEQ